MILGDLGRAIPQTLLCSPTADASNRHTDDLEGSRNFYGENNRRHISFGNGNTNTVLVYEHMNDIRKNLHGSFVLLELFPSFCTSMNTSAIKVPTEKKSVFQPSERTNVGKCELQGKDEVFRAIEVIKKKDIWIVFNINKREPLEIQ